MPRRNGGHLAESITELKSFVRLCLFVCIILVRQDYPQ